MEQFQPVSLQIWSVPMISGYLHLKNRKISYWPYFDPFGVLTLFGAPKLQSKKKFPKLFFSFYLFFFIFNLLIYFFIHFFNIFFIIIQKIWKENPFLNSHFLTPTKLAEELNALSVLEGRKSPHQGLPLCKWI